MRRFYFFMLCVLIFSGASAQEKLSKEEKERREKNVQAGNPFKQFGYKAKVATLSKGKYLEVHDLDSIVTIGSVRFNVDSKKIVGLANIDTLKDGYSRPVGDVASRWLSPDPKSEEFTNWSPYTFCYDNPVKYIDPDGQAAYSPIYGTGGQFLGTDSEGFKGQVLFMQESTFTVLGGQGMNHNVAMQAGQTLDQVIGDNPATTFNKSEVNMVNNAITDVVSKTDGLQSHFTDMLGTPMSSELHNGKTSSSYFEMGKLDGTPAVWQQANGGDNLGGAFPAVAQTDSAGGTAKVTFNLQQFSSMGLTVENVQNTFVHEFGKHFLQGVPGGSNAAHAGALNAQSLHSSWKGTTESYKQNIRNVFQEYMNKPLGR